MTYTELCTRIIFEAQRGGEAAEMANLNTQSITESIMPSVLQAVTKKYASGDSDDQAVLRQTHMVTLANGVGELPEESLVSLIWGSSVFVDDEATLGPLMSYAPWIEFINPSSTDTLLGRYSVRGNNEFYWADPGESYPTLTRDGDVSVTIASVLTIPADPDTDLEWPGEVESDVIDLAAEWLRGAKIAA